ncbi:hypothetical protein [Hymenobacter glacialis]|uniref:hypothetical protein n=1 Tax=Hymenobacter glacialis TaxID=1908236 RepID=UPI000F770988|nr:hypothetical protein [Hymenobacter glacialis]
MKKTKLALSSLLIALMAFLFLNLFLNLFVGEINWEKTLSTAYRPVDHNMQLVSTEWADLKTPKSWRNITVNSTCPGYVGALWTGNEFINYEYGMFAPDLRNHASTEQIKLDTLAGHLVYSVTQDEVTGFYIPPQGEMTSSLTLYPSKAGYQRSDSLRALLGRLKYKK